MRTGNDGRWFGRLDGSDGYVEESFEEMKRSDKTVWENKGLVRRFEKNVQKIGRCLVSKTVRLSGSEGGRQ